MKNGLNVSGNTALHKSWVKNYLSEKINSASLAVLVVLEQYIEWLNRFGMEGDTGFIIEMVSNKRLTPKEEQQVDVELNNIIRILNDFENSVSEKQQDIDEAKEKIENMLHLIIGYLTNEAQQ